MEERKVTSGYVEDMQGKSVCQDPRTEGFYHHTPIDTNHAKNRSSVRSTNHTRPPILYGTFLTSQSTHPTPTRPTIQNNDMLLGLNTLNTPKPRKYHQYPQYPQYPRYPQDTQSPLYTVEPINYSRKIQETHNPTGQFPPASMEISAPLPRKFILATQCPLGSRTY